MEKAYVKSATQHGLCSIEFFHPQSNSLPGALLQELAATIREAGKNAACRLILLRSQGQKAFCAGASFDELSQLKNEQEGLQFFSGFAEVINAMRTCGKIIVGRIHGKCVGGGVGLAAAVDYALATEEAAVKLSELAVGIGPFVVGPAVERKIGLSAFSQLALDAPDRLTTSCRLTFLSAPESEVSDRRSTSSAAGETAVLAVIAVEAKDRVSASVLSS